MRSTPAAELTPQVRIRNAAVVAFAENGYDRTSLREIAGLAGVSAALIVHHFGSKEGLRTACDDHVLGLLVEGGGVESGDVSAMLSLILDGDEYVHLTDYLGRLLVDGGPHADEFFDRVVASTTRQLQEWAAAGLIRPQSDPEVTAVTMALHGLGTVVLRRQVARVLGDSATSTLAPAVLQRLSVPTAELYTHGLFLGPDYLDTVRTAAAGLADPPPTPEEGSS